MSTTRQAGKRSRRPGNFSDRTGSRTAASDEAFSVRAEEDFLRRGRLRQPHREVDSFTGGLPLSDSRIAGQHFPRIDPHAGFYSNPVLRFELVIQLGQCFTKVNRRAHSANRVVLASLAAEDGRDGITLSTS